jgi:glycosyltransferase involved in cell wall biosynthesis
MKIVFLTDFLTPKGGAEKIAMELLKVFASQGLPVTVLVGETVSVDFPYGNVVSLDQMPLMSASAREAFFRGLFNVRSRDAVANLIEKQDSPDTIYIVNSWFQILSPSIFEPLASVASRVLILAHDFFLACPNGAYFDFRREEVCDLRPLSGKCVSRNCDKRNYLHKLWRAGVALSIRRYCPLYRNGSKVVAVHEGMVEHLARAGIPKTSIQVIRNPSTRHFPERVPAEQNREILYVGTLSAQKGFDVLVEALRERPWTVNIFGEGDLADLAASSPSHLKFHGFQSHATIAAATKRSRVILMPSRQRETFGLAAVEALGSGIPVIVSQQASLSADIRKFDCGLVVAPVGKKEIQASVDTLFADDVLTERLSRNGARAFTRISPSFESWGTQFIQLCRTATDSQSQC